MLFKSPGLLMSCSLYTNNNEVNTRCFVTFCVNKQNL